MNLDKAIQYSIENVIKEGLNDTLPRCFELELLKSKEFQKRIQENVLKSISGNSLESLGVNRISHVLLPKNSAFDFRRCALIQPLDVIKYSALVVSLADIIERNRIPLSEKVVYSYRFKINKGFLFNRNYSISSFLIKTREKAKRRQVGFIVSCDIANFYDRLNLHRLENILLSLGCDKARVKLINEVLLFWSNRDSYGLPVGTNASRILAEAALSGVDDYLKAQNVDFIRFVDDYRFFAPDANTAHYWLTILIERLWQEGLTINKSKTKIEASEQHKRLLRNFPKNENHQLVKKNSERNPFNIRAGYGGTVPTKFRNLSEKEKNAFSQMDLRAKIKTLAEKTFIESEEILEIVKIMVSKDVSTPGYN